MTSQEASPILKATSWQRLALEPHPSTVLLLRTHLPVLKLAKPPACA
jgi:hypothetical protein